MTTLKHFEDHEFRKKDKMDTEFLAFLDEVRGEAGLGFYLTSDARDAETNKQAGGVSTSLHVYDNTKKASAVDFVTKNSRNRNTQGYYEDLWKITAAVIKVANHHKQRVQLELVKGKEDWHIHLGLYPSTWLGTSKIILAKD